jgi:hypothetical protein
MTSPVPLSWPFATKSAPQYRRVFLPRSTTSEPATVTVQVVPAGRFAVGISVKAVAPPGGGGAMLNVSRVFRGHSSLNAAGLTFTSLLKLMVTVESSPTEMAPFAGTVEVTVGAESALAARSR